jgi:hypothetical protein
MVVPSLIAALPFCDATGDGITLLAKTTGSTLSIGLIELGHLRLVRCIDLSTEEMLDSDHPGRGAFPILQQTLAFAEDQLERKVNQALLCGFGPDTGMVSDQMENEFGIPAAAVSSRFGPAHGENAGLLGLLEQYTA